MSEEIKKYICTVDRENPCKHANRRLLYTPPNNIFLDFYCNDCHDGVRIYNINAGKANVQ